MRGALIFVLTWCPQAPLPAQSAATEFTEEARLVAALDAALYATDQLQPERAKAHLTRALTITEQRPQWAALANFYRDLSGDALDRTLAMRRDYERLQAVFATSRRDVERDLAALVAGEITASKAPDTGPLIRARLLNFLAVVRMDTPRAADADRLLAECAAVYDRFGLRGIERLGVRANRARLLVCRGNHERALPLLQSVLAHLPESGDNALRVSALINLAIAQKLRGERERCVETLARAAAAKRRANDEDGAWRLEVSRARELLALGHRRRAIAEIDALLAQPDSTEKPALRLERATLLMTLLGSAFRDERLDLCIRDATKLNNPSLAVGFLLQRSQRSMQRGDSDRALRDIDAAARMARAAGRPRLEAQTVTARASALLARHRISEAAALLEPLCTPGQPTDVRAAALLGLVRVRRRIKDLPAVADLLERMAAACAVLGHIDRQSLHLVRAAQTHFRIGNRDRGLALGRRALGLLPSARRSAAAWAAGVELPARSPHAYDRLLGEMLADVTAGTNPTNAAGVFAAAEALRAGSLIEEIRAVGTPTSRPSTLLRTLHKIDIAAGSPGAKARRVAVQRELALPDATCDAPAEAIRLVDLQAALDSDTGVLFFHVTRQRSGVWLVRKDTVRFRHLTGRRELRGLIRCYTDVLRRLPGPGAFRRVHREGRRLTRALLGEFEPAVRSCRRLAVIAGRDVASAPFSALVTGPDVDPQRERDVRFLGPDDGVRIVSTPSATILVHLMQQRPATSRGVLLAGDQDQDGTLPWIEQELAAVRTLVGPSRCVTVFGDHARHALTRDRTQPIAVLHVATHADAATPTAQPKLRLGSGTLTPLDMLGAGLRAELVNLAACHTHSGRWLRGEGLQGFVRAFLATGSRNVAASRWMLHDAAAARWSRSFYEHLDKGPVEAAYRARCALRADPKYAAPFYWAAVELVGSL